MRWRPRPGRSIVISARFGLHRCDEFLEILRREVLVHRHQLGRFRHIGDGHKVRQGIVAKILEDVLVDHDLRVVGEQQRVSIGRGAHHRLRARIAAGAATVLDDDILAKGLGQVL